MTQLPQARRVRRFPGRWRRRSSRAAPGGRFGRAVRRTPPRLPERRARRVAHVARPPGVERVVHAARDVRVHVLHVAKTRPDRGARRGRPALQLTHHHVEPAPALDAVLHEAREEIRGDLPVVAAVARLAAADHDALFEEAPGVGADARLAYAERLRDFVERERPVRKQEVSEQPPADAREPVGLEREAHFTDEPVVIAGGHAAVGAVSVYCVQYSLNVHGRRPRRNGTEVRSPKTEDRRRRRGTAWRLQRTFTSAATPPDCMVCPPPPRPPPPTSPPSRSNRAPTVSPRWPPAWWPPRSSRSPPRSARSSA